MIEADDSEKSAAGAFFQLTDMLSVAIDVMSGDRTPRDYVAGVAQALRDDPDFRALLVGDPATVESALNGSLAARAAQARGRRSCRNRPRGRSGRDGRLPREAIRRKKQSSMRIAIDVVKEGRALACVSAGNTGALTAMSHFVLKTLEGVERAAIMSAIPAAHGHTHMLDLGANTKATPEQLLQFGSMGSIVARDVYGSSAPRVGLLNIGEEDMKGHEISAGGACAAGCERAQLHWFRRGRRHLLG